MTRLQIILRDTVGCLPRERERELSKPNEQINQAPGNNEIVDAVREEGSILAPQEADSFYCYYTRWQQLISQFRADSVKSLLRFPRVRRATNCSRLRLYWLSNSLSLRLSANERARKLPLGWQRKLLGFCSKRGGHTRMPTRTRGLYLNGSSSSEPIIIGDESLPDSVTRSRNVPRVITFDLILQMTWIISWY